MNLWIEVGKWLWTTASGLAGDPPGGRAGGGGCGGAKHLQKKFSKKILH